MIQSKLEKSILFLAFFVLFLCSTSAHSLAAIEFDIDAIEAEITSAVAAGEEPVLAAKNAVANAVRAVAAANPDYPGGTDTLNAAIMEALANYKITGLDDTDLLLSGNHALGISIDPDLEAYEAPGAKGRANARNRGGNAYGPGGKPKPGSPT